MENKKIFFYIEWVFELFFIDCVDLLYMLEIIVVYC